MELVLSLSLYGSSYETCTLIMVMWIWLMFDSDSIHLSLRSLLFLQAMDEKSVFFLSWSFLVTQLLSMLILATR
jgi:hypothetical protein